jgi:hypothetical protein
MRQAKFARRGLMLGAVAMVMLMVSAAPASAATVVNGGFETGDFSGWTVVNQRGGSGDWFVYSRARSPLSGFPLPPTPKGTYAAVTDMLNPGSHVLYQDITLEPGLQHVIRFFLYYQNNAGVFCPRGTLDYSISVCNQQYRVDILDPDSGPFSLKPDDVLAMLFRTEMGDPATLAPTLMEFDVSEFAGQTVRLRFAEVDNQSFFQASVDDVGVITT